MKRPSRVNAVAAPSATPFWAVGRTMEQSGNFRLKKMHGSGMMRFFLTASPPRAGLLKSGKTKLPSVTGGALPALSRHVWKWDVSVGPMLRTIRKDFETGHLFGHGGVKAAPALLDEREVKARRVRDGLHVLAEPDDHHKRCIQLNEPRSNPSGRHSCVEVPDGPVNGCDPPTRDLAQGYDTIREPGGRDSSQRDFRRARRRQVRQFKPSENRPSVRRHPGPLSR
jgi:hypothetical protein